MEIRDCKIWLSEQLSLIPSSHHCVVHFDQLFNIFRDVFDRPMMTVPHVWRNVSQVSDDVILDVLEDYNESCDPTALTDTQHCYPEVDQEPAKFRILLLARNKYGAAMSSPRICKATWPSSGFLQPEDSPAFSTAGATLIMFLILLLLLLIILALIAVYYSKNRSHNYRGQYNDEANLFLIHSWGTTFKSGFGFPKIWNKSRCTYFFHLFMFDLPLE